MGVDRFGIQVHKVRKKVGWKRQRTEISKIRGTLIPMKTTQAGIRITTSLIARAKITT